MVTRRLALLGALAMPLLAAGAAEAADTLRVRLDWTPWGNAAPFHLAASKGWFAKHGLDVKIDDGNGSVATVQIVGNGEYDLGHASLATMAIARSKGLPVKAVAGLVRQNDIGLLVARDSGIKGPADLKGKKLAFTAGSLETPFLDRFLAAGNLKRTDVKLINVDAAAKAGTFMVGRADGAFSSVPFMLAVVNQQRPAVSVRFADYGLEFPSFGLFATEKTLAEKGPAVRRFASVVAGAWTYILGGREDEAVKAIIDARPQAKLNPAVLRTQIDTLKDYVFTEATRGKPIGTMDARDWERAVAVLSSGGLIEGTAAPAAYFVDGMVDPAIVNEVANGSR